MIDRGWHRIKRNIFQLQHAYAKIGLPADGETTGRYDMQKVITIGDAHEYGKGVPERSFLRTAVDEKRKIIQKKVDLEFYSILRGLTTVPMALKRTGDMIKDTIVAKIDSGNFTPLHPRTIARKGSSTPLIETGQLRSTIQTKVYAK